MAIILYRVIEIERTEQEKKWRYDPHLIKAYSDILQNKRYFCGVDSVLKNPKIPEVNSVFSSVLFSFLCVSVCVYMCVYVYVYWFLYV